MLMEALEALRHSVRRLRSTPSFTLGVVLILALAIGANAAVFSVVHAVLLAPLPFSEPQQLVALWETNAQLGRGHDHPSPGNLLDWRDQSRAFTRVAATYETSINLVDAAGAEEILVARITEDFFSTFGVEAALGRTIQPADVEADRRVVVLSHAFFQRRFGGDPAIVGRTVELAREPWKVIGVMPPGFAFPSADAELWQAWNMRTAYTHLDGPPRDYRFLQAVARLDQGVSLAQAADDLETIAARLAADHPATNRGWSASLTPLHEAMVGDTRAPLLVLCGAVALVLLLACASVAALLLARSLARQQEMAVRQALGASRWHLARPLLIESLLLGVGGGLLGFLLAQAGLDLLLALVPGDLPRGETITLDGTVLVFTLLVSLLTGLLFGLAPALAAGHRRGVAGPLAAGGRWSGEGPARQRLRHALVVAEVALAVVLLAGAGLLLRTFAGLMAVDPGFAAENRLVFSVRLNGAVYRGEGRSASYYRTLLEGLEAMPAVRAAGGVTALPMHAIGSDFDTPYWREEAPPGNDSPDEVLVRVATPGYFQTVGIPLLRGRTFTATDGPETRAVVIINQAMAEQVWPGEDPLGKRLMLVWGGTNAYEVIGVVGDTRFYGLRSKPQPEAFRPHAQMPYLPMNVVVHTHGDPLAQAAAVRAHVLALDPAQPAYSLVAFQTLVAGSVARERFALVLLTFLATVALGLAAAGVWGLLAHGVRLRSKEIGIRLALGARRRQVFRSTLGSAVRLTLIGLGCGLALAFALTRLMASLLYGVAANDPATYAAVAGVLLAAAFLAGYLPARQAASVDPAATLREG